MNSFNLNCKKCNRLSNFLVEVRANHPDYHALPVPSFGDPDARLLVVGMAPGMHGANATGRPFTGDHAGILLYQTLYDLGFSNQPDGVAIDDGLILTNCRITNAVRCLPPQNKVIAAEVNNCNTYLLDELTSLTPGSVVLAVGGTAHNAILKALGLKKSAYKFSHGSQFDIPNKLTLLSSYHCSRYNTNTKRLTTEMFNHVFTTAQTLLKKTSDTTAS
ncbi:MAG: uracil-DNA glycosylase [Gammaproteobacteria bacterium]|nr:uracil-DNA glycosylase [Gammaproteobacteria bacterium]MCP4090458.1 uracil-DNA glycosylase [Gammaproteobacteria bacterium]MCP4275433.1 uracil-DNA glycosylase [Gammaproteobacteria bacterium]MCP4832590.1 uracil-DNA glycosylase [Gammaproteobacteria bacterium]MCP4928109.1 uracil-DNA glycosylase [Gammaproteobacteria bacterium]